MEGGALQLAARRGGHLGRKHTRDTLLAATCAATGPRPRPRSDPQQGFGLLRNPHLNGQGGRKPPFQQQLVKEGKSPNPGNLEGNGSLCAAG